MSEGNGHSKTMPNVNIHKDGKIDADTLQSALIDFKDVLVSIDEKVGGIKEKQDKLEKDIKPVISFYRKVLTIITFCAAMFTAYKTGIWEWIKKIFSE